MKHALTGLLSCCLVATLAADAIRGQNLKNILDYQERVSDGDWNEAITQAIADVGDGGAVFFPKQDYKIGSRVEIQRDVTLLFQGGAKLWTTSQELIRIRRGGQIVIESLGSKALLENANGESPAYDDRNIPRGAISSVINIDHVEKGAAPSLRLKNLHLRGFVCLEGFRNPDKGEMGVVEVIDCHLEAGDMHMAHKHSKVGRLEVRNSLFTGDARYGVNFISPMPGGAVVKDNVLRNVGIRAIQLSGEKNMIADGCVNYLPNAIVQGNQILGGGHRATVGTSYILGILVYGHNVSITDNIVRDFNRGQPAADGEIGHVVESHDGKRYDDIWIEYDDNPRRRLAGAAIYAKARQLVIANNICSNSGYRAVIEVKTSGCEPYALICDNVVDGQALAVKDSFGFECATGRSLWSGNLIYDMPNTAFVVRGHMENTFSGNVIFNAKTGFETPVGDAGVNELIAHNRFVNVENKIAPVSTGSPKGALGATLTTEPPIVVRNMELLPKPSEARRGQIALLRDERADKLLICRLANGLFRWQEITLGDDVKQARRWREKDSSLIADLKTDFDAWAKTVNAKNYKGHLDVFSLEPKTGSMRIGNPNALFAWMLQRSSTLKPGKTYRFKAEVHSNSNIPKVTLWAVCEDKTHSTVGHGKGKRETLTVDFTIPEESSGETKLKIHGNRTGQGKAVWIDSVALHELEPVSAPTRE